jgi:hypothetical protein
VKIRNAQDFWSGVMFVAFGLFFALYGQANYRFGTAQRMGPGFFPIVLGVILAGLGALVLLQALRAAHRAGTPIRFDVRAVAWVLGSVVGFAFALPTAGLLVSITLLVIVAMLGSHEFRWREALGVCLVMVVIVYLVFSLGLKMTVPVLPVFPGR